MKEIKKLNILIIFFVMALLISSCGSTADADVAVKVALTQTASAAAAVVVPSATPVALGSITGTANYMAPPTPAIKLFAINIETGEWFTVTTTPSDTASTFVLEVPAGNYTVFGQGIGYPSMDGWSLGIVSVVAGQATANINVSPPSQNDCGSMFGIPAAPDGSFLANPGPDEACMASVMAGNSPSEQSSGQTSTYSLNRITFAAGSTMSQTPGYISEAIGGHHYVLGASGGQYMTVNLYTGGDAILVIWGNNGTTLLDGSAYAKSWSGTLPATQDYFIDVRSMSQSPVDYTLEVSISALAGGQISTTNKSFAIEGAAISGALNYPESYVPPMHIVAFNQDTGSWFWQGTAENSYTYTMLELPAGRYHIVAYTKDGLVGAYASVGDGQLIPLDLKEGEMPDVPMNVWLERDNPYYPGSSDPVGW
jgi:hypothetical protein